MRITLCILVILPYLTLAFNGGIKFYELDDTRCKYLRFLQVFSRALPGHDAMKTLFRQK